MDERGSNRTDWLVSIAKGLAGSVPIVGPLSAELIGTFIPNQRLDRLERFLAVLEQKVSAIDPEVVNHRFRDPEYADLLEDGFNQALRALTDQRRTYIAGALRSGLADKDLRHLEQKRLLTLLGQINDVEVLILRAAGAGSFASRHEFERSHPEVKKPYAPFGAPAELHERAAIHQSYVDHLVSLGLLRERYDVPDGGQLPRFDRDRGTLVSRGTEITVLGKALLRFIGENRDREA